MAKGDLQTPLKGIKNSYDQDGRAVSGIDGKPQDCQLPQLPSEAYNYSGSGDSGRRNK